MFFGIGKKRGLSSHFEAKRQAFNGREWADRVLCYNIATRKMETQLVWVQSCRKKVVWVSLIHKTRHYHYVEVTQLMIGTHARIIDNSNDNKREKMGCTARERFCLLVFLSFGPHPRTAGLWQKTSEGPRSERKIVEDAERSDGWENSGGLGNVRNMRFNNPLFALLLPTGGQVNRRENVRSTVFLRGQMVWWARWHLKYYSWKAGSRFDTHTCCLYWWMDGAMGSGQKNAASKEEEENRPASRTAKEWVNPQKISTCSRFRC